MNGLGAAAGGAIGSTNVWCELGRWDQQCVAPTGSGDVRVSVCQGREIWFAVLVLRARVLDGSIGAGGLANGR